MKKIIAIFTETFYPDPCGVADYVNTIVHNFDKENYDIHVITRTDTRGKKETVQYENIFIHKIINTKLYIFNVPKFIVKLNPDIVDIQMSFSGASRFNRRNILTGLIVPIIRFLIPNAKIVVTIHEICKVNKNKNIIENIYSSIRDFPFLHFSKNFIIADMQYVKYINKKNYTYISGFSSIPTYIGEKKVNKNKIVFFGTLTRNKNIEFLIDIIKKLREKDDYYLDIIGATLDKDYKNMLLDYINNNNLSKCVEFSYIKNAEEVAEKISNAEYAIFAFKKKLTIRNTSVLASVVQGTKTFIYSDEKLYSCNYRFDNLFVLDNLNIDNWVKAIINSKMNQSLKVINNKELVSRHVIKRMEFYDNLL